MTREEAINVIKGARQYLTVGNPIWNVKKVDEAMNMAIEALSDRPTDEWCTDCKEYDHEKHCCPRFNRVIRTTLNEAVANLKEEFESAVPNCKKCAIKELWKATEKEDLVEVVRCKDCRHGEHIQIPLWENRDIDKAPSQFHDFIKCHKFHIKGFNETLYLGDDDFCSYGEKRK